MTARPRSALIDPGAVLDAALAYAARGWPVLPLYGTTDFTRMFEDGRACWCRDLDCKSPGKHPRTEHGLKDASTDPDVIRDWFGNRQRAFLCNLGLATGVAFDVLDVDTEEALDLLDQLGDTTCGGPMVRTGRGWQYLFSPTGVGNRTGLVPGADWRGRGGYVVVPPSVHITGRRYSWLSGPDTPLEPPPPAIRALLDSPKQPPVERSSRAGRSPRRNYSGLIAKVAVAPEGERNAILHWAACRAGEAHRRGEPDLDGLLDALHLAATRAGLSETETSATIKSALRGA